MSFTYNYPVPTDASVSIRDQSRAACVVVGKDVWIFTDTHYFYTEPRKMEIFKFNTETKEMRAVNYTTPPNFGKMLICVEAANDQIYIWKVADEPEESFLFRFDTNTAILTNLVTIGSHIHGPCPIIGDLMYVLDNSEGTVFVNVINLVEGKIVTKKYLMTIEYEMMNHLVANNGNLYMMIDTCLYQRIVYKITEDQMVQVSRDRYSTRKDGMMKLSHTKDGAIYLKASKCKNKVFYYKDTFDFVKCQWSRMKAGKPWIYPMSLDVLDKVDIDGKEYVLMFREHTKRADINLRVLEKVPTLETASLLKLVTTAEDDTRGIQMVRQCSPFNLRVQLDDMLKWRVTAKKEEKIGKLKDRQLNKTIVEIYSLKDEKVIDAEMAEALSTVFLF